MKHRNQRIYSNLEHLEMLAEEQEVYIGRPYRLDRAKGCLTIFAKPQKKHKKRREHKERDKREEKFERRA